MTGKEEPLYPSPKGSTGGAWELQTCQGHLWEDHGADPPWGRARARGEQGGDLCFTKASPAWPAQWPSLME